MDSSGASRSSRGTTCFPGSMNCWLRGETFANLDTGDPLASIRPRVVIANAYLGSAAIAEAWARGRTSSLRAGWPTLA